MTNKIITIKNLFDEDELNKLSNMIYTSFIKTFVENDGIGAYEFWGQRCFDRGTDFLIIDEAQDFIIETKVAKNLSIEDITKIILDALPETRSISQEYKGQTLELNLKLQINNQKITRRFFTRKFTCEVSWQDID